MEGERRLAPFGKTLSDAVEFYVRHLEDSQRSIPVSALVTEYMDEQNGSDTLRFTRMIFGSGSRGFVRPSATRSLGF